MIKSTDAYCEINAFVELSQKIEPPRYRQRIELAKGKHYLSQMRLTKKAYLNTFKTENEIYQLLNESKKHRTQKNVLNLLTTKT